MTEKSLKDEIKELTEVIKESQAKKEKKKEFKIPFFKRVRPSQAKKNYITVIKINENGHVEFLKKQIEEQTIMVDGIPRLANGRYIMHHKKNPIMILPTWSVEPLDPAKHYEQSLLNGSNSKGYKLLMSKMKSSSIESKKIAGGMLKWIIGLGLALIIGYAFITGGG